MSWDNSPKGPFKGHPTRLKRANFMTECNVACIIELPFYVLKCLFIYTRVCCALWTRVPVDAACDRREKVTIDSKDILYFLMMVVTENINIAGQSDLLWLNLQFNMCIRHIMASSLTKKQNILMNLLTLANFLNNILPIKILCRSQTLKKSHLRFWIQI